MNKKEQIIADIWKNALHIENIDPDDNFFDLGGTSVKALEINEECKKAGIMIPIYKMFTCQTVREIAEVAEFSQNPYRDVDLLMDVVKKIETFSPDEAYNQELAEYQKKCEEVQYKTLGEPEAIFITGATGYIACHIIKQILTNSHSRIYALIRRNEERFWKRIQFYFPDELIREKYSERITFVNGDLTKNKFGLSEEQYNSLAETVDSVIHTAANINHYGTWNEFEELNINGTKRVIQFVKTGREKSLNHVSTIATSHTYKRSKTPTPFTEYNTLLTEDAENYYVKSKLISENLVVSEKGNFKFKIFRPSNIIQSYQYGKFPYGINRDNLYLVNTELSILNLLQKNDIFPEIHQKMLDFSYVDETAESIYRLMGIEETDSNSFIYHVYNPNIMTISEYANFINMKKTSVADFSQLLKEKYESISYDLKQLCTLSIAEGDVNQALIIVPQNQKTVNILSSLGFTWHTLEEKNKMDILNF
ncbi:MAG: SDR family oxidoreductase [Ruminococcus sp.]|nr:SDR family oxidoreductase [Ruminococcus sp.]